MDVFPDNRYHLCIHDPADRKRQGLCPASPCAAEKTEKLSTKITHSARLHRAPLSGQQELFPGISLRELGACSAEEKALFGRLFPA